MGSEKKLKKKKIKHGVEKKKGTWRWKTEREDERLKKGLFGARFPLLSPDFFLQKPPSCCPFFSLHTTLRIFSLQCMCCPKISSNACATPKISSHASAAQKSLIFFPPPALFSSSCCPLHFPLLPVLSPISHLISHIFFAPGWR